MSDRLLKTRPFHQDVATTTSWVKVAWGFPCNKLVLVNKTPGISLVRVKFSDTLNDTGIELSSIAGLQSRVIDDYCIDKLLVMSPVAGATLYVEAW